MRRPFTPLNGIILKLCSRIAHEKKIWWEVYSIYAIFDVNAAPNYREKRTNNQRKTQTQQIWKIEDLDKATSQKDRSIRCQLSWKCKCLLAFDLPEPFHP